MTLSDHHLSELKSSCVSQEIIESRGYRTVTEEERGELVEMGVPVWATRSETAFPGLLIPMYRATGEQISYQFKPAAPQKAPGRDGKPMKYVSLRGTPNVLDVHPSSNESVRGSEAPLWVTEGVKKADALASRGIAAIALTGVWNWRGKTGALGDWEDVPLKDRTVVICFDADARENRMVMLAMRRFGAWLTSKKVQTVQYLIVPAEVNGVKVKGVDDYFAAGGDLAGLRDAAVKQLPTDGAKDAKFSDSYLAETVCEESLVGRYLWAMGEGWLEFDGSRWASSSEVKVTEEVRRWAKDRFQDTLDEQRRDVNRDMKDDLSGWRSVLSIGRIGALVKLAKGLLFTDIKLFDADPDLLNTPNGVVDLRTGELLPPDASYLMTKVTGVEYKPGFRCSDFDTALESLPPEVHEWYQIRMGQAFTGHMTPDDLLIVQQGGGENGKSSLNVPLSKAAGSYYVMISHRVLTGDGSQHPTELMEFRGARLAMMEETPEARRLDPQTLRMVIGTPQITARKIRQDTVTFDATHSMFVNTNFKPVVTETDHGTWRRLALLVFPYRFRKSSEACEGPWDKVGDPDLRLRLLENPEGHQAALAWAVEGAVKWYANNRTMPTAPKHVRQATREWREEGDEIMSFLGEEATFGRDLYTPSIDLYNKFTEWSGQRGGKPWSVKLFKSRFEVHEVVRERQVSYTVKKVHGKAVKVWDGVKLQPPTDDEDGPQGGGGNPFDPGDDTPPMTPSGGANIGAVTAVTATAVNSIESSIAKTTRAAVTPVTSQFNGTFPTEPTKIGFDLETGSATERWSEEDPSYVRVVGFDGGTGTDPSAVREAIEAGHTLVGHNIFNFDLPVLERHCGIPLETTTPHAVDVRLQAWLADPPSTWETSSGPGYKSYSLDAISERVLGEPKDERGAALAKEFGGWDHIPADDPRYHEYCKDDADRALRIHKALPWTPYMEREMKVQAIMSRMSTNGFKVNVPLVHERISEGEATKQMALRVLHSTYGIPLGSKSPLATKAGKQALVEALREAGAPFYPKTDNGQLAAGREGMDKMIEHYGHLPAVREIAELVKTVTGTRTVYHTLQSHLHGDRVHPTIWPGQASGRWSITEPGLTVLGKRGPLAIEREVMIADEGELLIAVDLGQVDARIVAAHAQDTNYLKLFEPGRDLHSEIAMKIFGDVKYRSDAKAFGHGTTYGLGQAKMVEAGHDAERVRLFFEGQQREFPRLQAWKSEVRELGAATGRLDNGFGRPLMVQKDRAYTQAPAQIGQGGTRDMMAEGMMDLARNAPETLPMLRALVHDEVVLSVPEDRAEEIGEIVVESMHRYWAPFGYEHKVEIISDCTTPAKDWYSAYKG